MKLVVKPEIRSSVAKTDGFTVDGTSLITNAVIQATHDELVVGQVIPELVVDGYKLKGVLPMWWLAGGIQCAVDSFEILNG